MEYDKMISVALRKVAEIKQYADAGMEPDARQARADLNSICGNHADGYPAQVRDALKRAGLRSTFG